jgi:hypothetical protein
MGLSTYQPRDLSLSISLRSPRPPYSASPHSRRPHSTDKPSGRSGIRSPFASNTKRSDSRGTVQDRYARNRRIRANAPCASPRGGHDAIRGEKRARRLGSPCAPNARPQKGLVGRAQPEASLLARHDITDALLLIRLTGFSTVS